MARTCFGALLGGLLKAVSLWTGIWWLLVVAALLYLASWAALALKLPMTRKAA